MEISPLLLAKPDEETLKDEGARMLFHTRFALGLLLLAKGEKQQAKALLCEVAGTKVSGRDGEIIQGRAGEIIWLTALHGEKSKVTGLCAQSKPL